MTYCTLIQPELEQGVNPTREIIEWGHCGVDTFLTQAPCNSLRWNLMREKFRLFKNDKREF
jgi:hypothetical protein